MNLLRKFSVAIASLTTVSSMAFGAMDMDSRVTQLENQMQQVRTETVMGTYGATTATARPEVNGYGWFISANVLLWHAKIGGTEYAYSAGSLNADFPIIGEVKGNRFDWEWGFRVGIGYNFLCDGWDIGVLYTYFRPDDDAKLKAGNNGAVVPLLGASNIGINAQTAERNVAAYRVVNSATSQYDIKYQTIDLELGRAYFISRTLSFRPHWGLKTAWIDLERTARYTGTPSCTNSTNQSVLSDFGLGCDFVQVRDDSDFWGLGPRAGINSKWHLGCGFSIFGNISGALLYGYFDVRHEDRRSPDQSFNLVRLDADKHAFTPTAQMFLGLRYDGYMHCDQQHIGIGLGYEVNYWWRVNQMLKIDDYATLKYERYSEDLSLYGITLDIRWDF